MLRGRQPPAPPPAKKPDPRRKAGPAPSIVAPSRATSGPSITATAPSAAPASGPTAVTPRSSPPPLAARVPDVGPEVAAAVAAIRPPPSESPMLDASDIAKIDAAVKKTVDVVQKSQPLIDAVKSTAPLPAGSSPSISSGSTSVDRSQAGHWREPGETRTGEIAPTGGVGFIDRAKAYVTENPGKVAIAAVGLAFLARRAF